MPTRNIYQPLVSIVITAYNREKYIEEAIQSALDQDYENLEIIVSNNASTDSTESIILQFLSDERIKYFNQETNIGMAANFEFATRKASGSFIAYLSSDDYFIDKSFISQSVLLINKYPDVSLALSTFNRIIEKSGHVSVKVGGSFEEEFYRGPELFLRFPELTSISFAGAVMHKAKLEKLKVFDIPCTALDVMALLKLMLVGNVVCNNTPSYMLRIHGNNLSSRISLSQAIDNFRYIESPYNEALIKGIATKEKLRKWRTNSAFLYCRFITVQFVAQNIVEYKMLLKHIEINFPDVKKKLQYNFKWNVLMFFFKRPEFSLKFLKYTSRPHYHYLKSLVSIRLDRNSEEIEEIKL